MHYVVIFLIILALIVHFWKQSLIIAVVVGLLFIVIRFISSSITSKHLAKIKAQSDEDFKKRRIAAEQLQAHKRELIKSEILQEQDNLNTKRKATPLLDWTSIEAFHPRDTLHFEFMKHIATLAAKATLTLGAIRGTTWKLNYYDFNRERTCDFGEAFGHNELAIHFQYDHEGDREEEYDRSLLIKYKGSDVLKCEEWDPEDTWVENSEIVRLQGPIVGKKYTIEMFRPGEWINELLSFEAEINALETVENRRQRASIDADHKSKFGKI